MPSVPFEKIVEEDLNLGVGTVNVTMPAGGMATGRQINPSTFKAIAFGAYGAGTQVAVGGAAPANVELTAEDFDTYAWFAAHKWTPLKAGYYQINADLTLAAFSGVCTLGIYRNDVLLVSVAMVRVAAVGSTAISTTVFLDGIDDFVTIKVSHTDGANNRTVTAAHMSGYCVGGQ